MLVADGPFVLDLSANDQVRITGYLAKSKQPCDRMGKPVMTPI